MCNGDVRDKLVPCETILEYYVTTSSLTARGRHLPSISQVVEVRFVFDGIITDTRCEEEAKGLADRIADTVVSLVDRKSRMVRVLAVAGNRYIDTAANIAPAGRNRESKEKAHGGLKGVSHSVPGVADSHVKEIGGRRARRHS
jgi:hypothetical protein